MEETTESDGELENDLECDEESDVEVFSWDGLLIEDDDDSEAMYFWVVRQLVANFDRIGAYGHLQGKANLWHMLGKILYIKPGPKPSQAGAKP